MPTKERMKELIREARAGRLQPPVPSIRVPGDKAEEPSCSRSIACNGSLWLGPTIGDRMMLRSHELWTRSVLSSRKGA